MRRSYRILGDFVLIVAGVLVALFAQGFVDRRGDAALADEYLERLLADVQSDSTILAFRVQFFRGVRARGLETLAWLASDAPGDEQVLVGAYLAAERWTFQPASGTYEDLKSSGNLRLIDDLELRSLLSDYYAELLQRREVWNLPGEYRSTVRGIVPLILQEHVSRGCVEEGAPAIPATPLDRVSGQCAPSGAHSQAIRSSLAELRRAPQLSIALRYLLSELVVSIRLYDDQISRASNLAAYIRERG